MKSIAFDLGNVLFHMNINKFLDDSVSLTGIPRNEFENFLNDTQKVHDLGLVNFHKSLDERFNLTDNKRNEIYNLWMSSLIPEEKTIALFKHLADFNNIAVLSNMGTDHKEFVLKYFGNHNRLIENVNWFFSCDVGARKPSYVYFNTFLSMNPDYRDCLFIDDSNENLETASSKFGLRTYNFDLSKIENLDTEVDRLRYEIYTFLHYVR